MTVLGGIPGSHKEQLCDTLLYLTESHIRSVNIIHTIYIASRARYKNTGICPKVIEKPLESFVTHTNDEHTLYMVFEMVRVFYDTGISLSYFCTSRKKF